MSVAALVVIVMRVIVVVRRDEDAACERRTDERGEKGECSKAFQENLRSFSVDSTLAVERTTGCVRL